jgi:hypothetical protein
MNVDIEILKVLVGPLLRHNTQVYIAEGCGRIYVAPIPSKKCKKCQGVHTNHAVSSLEDIEALYP